MARGIGRTEATLGRALVEALSRAAAALPPGAAERAGQWLGDGRRLLRPRDVEAVRENLGRLGLADAEAEDRLVRETFRAFGLFALEFFRGLRASPNEVARACHVTGWHHAEGLAVEPAGFIVACAHTGNWEHLAALAHRLDRRIVAPAETQFHPWLSPAVGRAKLRWQIDTVPPDRGLRDLLRALARGRIVALPLDGGSYWHGAPVRLRGAWVRLPAGAAQLAIMSGRPILPVFGRRTATGQEVQLLDPVRPRGAGTARSDRAAEIGVITQQLADLLGAHLERARGQWCIFRALDWEDAPAVRPASRPALAALPDSR